MSMWPLQLSNARPSAPTSSHVAIPASALAASAGRKRTEQSRSWSTDDASEYAGETTRHASIRVGRSVTRGTASRVTRHALLAVATPCAARSVTNRALYVRRWIALHDALTRSARCHVRHHAIGFPAPSAAKRSWSADINVHHFVARCVRHAVFVRSAGRTRFSLPSPTSWR